jgi:UDP-N-acetyl-2-amino-2-deoxyglucuronate dehydrogenase
MATAVHPVEVETHGAAIIRFKNGVIGSLDLTNLTYPDDREGSITIMGEKGTVKIGGKSMNKVIDWVFADEDPDDQLIYEAESNPPTVYGYGHVDFYQRVARFILFGEGETEIPDGREGRRSVALLEAIYLSDKLGAEIRFPLDSRLKAL